MGKARQYKMKTACGTKGYLAPELLKGKKYTHKCDIFALGIILFTTFAGFPPFQNAVDTDWWWDKLSKGWKYIVASEKQKYQKDRQKHIDAGQAKVDLFWKAHERTRQFDKPLKNLLERMLHPYAEYRYDIKHIKVHGWYAGKTYNGAELRQYLQSRVRKVVKERAQKIKKQLEEQGQIGSIERFVRRDPTSKGQEEQTPMEIRAKELDPKNEFSTYMDHFKDEGGDEDVIFACKQFLIDDADYHEDEEEQIDLTNSGKRFVVSFKRLRGSHLAYQKAIEDFYGAKEIMAAMDFSAIPGIEEAK